MTEWEFPWPKPQSVYDAGGPKDATVVYRTHGTYLVAPSGDIGRDTFRPRYYVECITCRRVLHRNTTGPANHILAHEETP